MRIVLLTRTSRPSGAIIARGLFDNKKDLVAVIAENRQALLAKKGSNYSVLINSFKEHGFSFTFGKLSELVKIKLHFLLRKLKIIRSNNYLSIEEFVLAAKIPYYLVKDHNSKDTQGLIRTLHPDLIVIANTRLIKKNIFQISKRGAINLHGSLLPKYAGLDSMFWALFYAEKKVGVTAHFVTEDLDRGDIILQKEFLVSKDDNEKTLHRKALKIGAKVIAQAVSLIEENRVLPIKQDMATASKFSWPTKQQRQELREKLKIRRKSGFGPVKVLHIITRLVKGGAQENTLLTVLGLQDKGYEVVLASGPSLGPEGEIETRARECGVDLIIIPQLVRAINPWKDAIAFAKIFFLIKRHNFDIVHTHTSKAGILGRFAARLAGVPVVVHTPHGHVFHDYFGGFKTKLFHVLEIVSSHFCDKIITLTDRCKEDHIRFKIAAPDKFITIPSGIQLERFIGRSFEREAIKSSLNIPLNKRVAGTIARLEPIKGVNFFVDAMDDVLAKLPDVHFLVVGDGSQRDCLEKMAAKLGIQQSVTFTGLRNDIPQLLSIMDLFVLASLNEGMGRVIVEAGIMAKPIVATKVSGIPELIQHGLTGILVESKNSAGLAAGIIEVLSDPDKARLLGENAQAAMRENFSAQIMVDKIDALYKDLLKNKLTPGLI